MKTNYKINIKMLVAVLILMAITVILCIQFKPYDIELENNIYMKYQNDKGNLTLRSDVVVINISTESSDSLTPTEKENKRNKQIEELKYLFDNGIQNSKGVFILENDLFGSPSTERLFINSFRNNRNVFWHYNNKNISYYHPDDKCGQIKFLDSFKGNSDSFEVFGEKKYDRNFLPYYLMTMDGGKVKYCKEKGVYNLVDKVGRKSKLYATSDGTIRRRHTSKYDVKYYKLDAVYQILKMTQNKKGKFDNKVIFIQNDKVTSAYSEKGNSSETLSDYYIDVLGTIENQATIKEVNFYEETILILIGIAILAIVIEFMSIWSSVSVYFLLIGGGIFSNMILAEYNVCYVPIIKYFIILTVTFVLLNCTKKILFVVNTRNLPIDAVIRFTNNIMNIESSISYSEYLSKNRREIEEDISAVLLLTVMEEESFLLEQLSKENNRNKRFVENEFRSENKNAHGSVSQTRTNLFEGVKYIAFIPLPVFDVESENVMYTVIGLKKKLKSQNASYISMMLFSMYIYFKAQHERGEHQRMYFSMLALMISVIDAKDPITAGHSQRVASISKDIGIWLKLNRNQQFDLEFTALLHDIGKIGVSDYVLNKQSVYTQNDFEQMKYHTIRGAEMLAEVGISDEIIDGVRHHHERIDGKGYPDGLKGEELTLFAKIIKIADVYDALTSKRQYKDAWGVEKALNIIYKGRGTEFDSDIADVFIKHTAPPGWIPPESDTRPQHVSDPFVKRTSKIVMDLYHKYGKYISVEYPIPSKKANNLNFFYETGFMKYDWGETFNNADFLEEKPMILSYEKDSKSLFFGQGAKSDVVQNIYYYFFKGFVNLGVYLLKNNEVNNLLLKLEEKYGESQIVDSRMMIFHAKKTRIVFYRTEDEKCLLFYISDYMCSNYIFEDESKKEEL